MDMHVEELNNQREWEASLCSSPEGTFYHSLKWKEVIEKSFSYSPLYLTIKDANGTVVGVCPGFILRSIRMKIFRSTPYSDYGGPVIQKHYIKRASHALQSFLQRFCANNSITYAKICLMNCELASPFESVSSYVDTSKGSMEINLEVTSSGFIWNKIFSKNRRWKIRRLERDGFQAEEARTKSDLRDFYNLYFKNMKYIGASPYPYGFIENMWSILYPENLRIWLVGKSKRIGGILVFKHGLKTYWAYAGIDRTENYKRYSVIPYLLWKEIERAEEEGCKYVSLGGTPSDPSHPYHLQKMSFGASFNQHEVVWYPLNSTGRILLETRAKTISTWKTIRDFVPIDLKRILESKLSKF